MRFFALRMSAPETGLLVSGNEAVFGIASIQHQELSCAGILGIYLIAANMDEVAEARAYFLRSSPRVVALRS